MDLILGFVFYSIFISGGFLTVQGFVHSSPDTALRFSQCLIEKMGESQLFSEEDKYSMMEVANVMSQALLNQNQRRLSPKILLTAFMTSMADVISHQDLVKSSDRKGFYTAALDQCSIISTGYVDGGFIEESLSTLSSIEKSKQSKIEETGAYQGSEVRRVDSYMPSLDIRNPAGFGPVAVQPSPVQNPQLQENFNPNGGAIFGLPNFPSDPYPILSNPNTRTNSQFQVQSGILSGLGVGSISQVKTDSLPVPSFENSQGSYASYISDTSQGSSAISSLNVPQTRESAVVVIPPAENKPLVPNYSFPNQPQETSGILFKPVGTDDTSRPQGDTGIIISSASLPQPSRQDQNLPSDSALENPILDMLIKSEKFRNAFNFNVPQEGAINLARSITEKSFAGYDLNFINEALTAVSDEIAKVNFRSPENYALALSNALVYVLKLHNMPLFINDSPIASVLLSNLQDTQQFSPQAKNIAPQFSSDYVNPEWKERPIDYYFESPPLAPEDRGGEIFSEVLGQYLSESKELSDFFCKTDSPENRIQIYFAIIKASLFDYSPQISSVAAGITSSALAEFSKEDLCSKYAKTIAEAIAEVLDENRLMEGANAERIAKQMIFNLSQQTITTNSQNSKSLSNKFSQNETTVIPYSKVATIQPSFKNDTITSSKILLNSMTSYEDGAPGVKYDIPTSPIQISSDSYTIPVTTPFTIQITDEEFTNAMTFVEMLTNRMEVPSTESSFDWSPSGYFEKDELASYLLEELESILESYDDKATDDSHNPVNETQTAIKNLGNSPDALILSSFKTEKENDRNNTENGKRNFQTQSESLPTTFSEDSKVDLVELQPSFQGPTTAEYSPSRELPSISDAISSDDAEQKRLTAVAIDVSQIATSSIAYIRSGNFDINELCARINELAPIVNIPPLDYCQEVPAIDYLLNVLRSVTRMLKGV